MVVLTANSVLYLIITFLWTEYLWELYLSLRQYKVAKKTKTIPKDLTEVLKKDEFEKARLYSTDKLKFDIIKDTISIIVSTLGLWYSIFARVWEISESINMWEGEVAVSCIWLFLFNIIQTVIDLPLSIYYTFVLEERYGFNKQTWSFYVIDKIKSFILNQALSLPISAITIVIVKYGGDLFFLWLWMAVGLLTIILVTIYPSYIAPLFDKYTELPVGELRTDIETLASELKFPLAQLYVVEGSKRSSHSNAYFYGLFKTKRIVLFDTLLKNKDNGGCENDEILAVLSHELGHWKHGHMTKNVVIMQVNLFLMFAVFALLFKYPLIYTAVGFRPNLQPVLVGLLIVVQHVMMPYNALLSFLMTVLSRKFEFQADEFAVNLNKGEALKRSLIQLNRDNLGFPVYDHLYSAWHHSHPPLLERINSLTAKAALLTKHAKKLN